MMHMDSPFVFGDDHLQLVLVKEGEEEHVLVAYSPHNVQEAFSFLGYAGLQVLNGNPFPPNYYNPARRTICWILDGKSTQGSVDV